VKQRHTASRTAFFRATRSWAVLVLAILLFAFAACNRKATEERAIGKAVNQEDFKPVSSDYITNNPDSARALQEAISRNSGGNLEELIKEGRVFRQEKH